MSDVDDMMAWEQGDLSDDDTVALFQRLVNNGMAWKLQGAYGRMATRLLDAGMITSPFQVVAETVPTCHKCAEPLPAGYPAGDACPECLSDAAALDGGLDDQ